MTPTGAHLEEALETGISIGVRHGRWSCARCAEDLGPADLGGRDGTRCHAVEVQAIRMEEVLAKHGVPYYMKIDIEQGDMACLQGLRPGDVPKYLSVEAHFVEYFCVLYNLGYRDFKWLTEDPDLEDLRHHDAYKRIRLKVRSLKIKVH